MFHVSLIEKLLKFILIEYILCFSWSFFFNKQYASDYCDYQCFIRIYFRFYLNARISAFVLQRFN